MIERKHGHYHLRWRKDCYYQRDGKCLICWIREIWSLLPGWVKLAVVIGLFVALTFFTAASVTMLFGGVWP